MERKLLSLHPAQRDVYTDQLLNPASPHYNIGGYIRLKGHFNKDNFTEIIHSIPAVFDVFKMRFTVDSTGPVYFVQEEDIQPRLKELDFSNAEDPGQSALQWMKDRFNTAFALDEEQLLFENCLIKIADDEHWFFGRFHHLITDGFGFLVIIQYVAQKYKSLQAGDGVEFSYPSYIEETLKAAEYFNSENYVADAKYWKEKIAEKPVKVLQPRYALQNLAGDTSATYIRNIDPPLKKMLDEIQLSTRSGLQHLTIAALIIYLGKTSGESHYVFGIPIHKRSSKKMRNTVGMFSGILPFNGVYNQTQSVIGLVKEITQSQRIDYRHQDFPIGDLTHENREKDDRGYLHEISINYEPLNFSLDFGDKVQGTVHRLANDHEPVPLQICWREYGNDNPLQLHVHYRKEYFEAEEVSLLMQRLLYILEQFPQNFEEPIGSIDILPTEERSVLQKFSFPGKLVRNDKTLVSAFEEQVITTPLNTALVFEDQNISYQQLNDRANQLAHYLKSAGVKKEELIPLCIERSINMMVAILGILKAGAAYVPIDPAYPADRIAFILDDIAAGVCITSKASRSKLPPRKEFNIISLDEDESIINDQPAVNPSHNILPGQLAYIIYTSGSTGKPKGVMIEHGTVINLVSAQTDYFNIDTTERILQFSNYCFDASVEQIFLAWLNGATLVSFREGLQLDIERFGNFLVEQKITHLHATPSFLENLSAEDPGSLKCVIAGGDLCKKELADRWKDKIDFCNEYGPTETTVTAIEYCVITDDLLQFHSLPIGKPLSHIRVYILDKNNELCPIGVSGEICIGGDCLARGYLNRPDLTAEKFVSDPFSGAEGKMYKTGDIGRWLADGNIVYQGRVDEQVKIRGYRIELGEIENVLQASDMIQQAVVLAREDKQGSKRLIAFVVPRATFNRSLIKEYLKGILPEYMIPALWVELEALPITSNGKVDKKALKDPDASELLSNEYVAPGNEIEAQLAEMWKEILKIEKVGVNDNFFELGGHSLNAIQLSTRLHKLLNIKVDIATIFNQPTIKLLATAVNLEKRNQFVPIPTLPPQDYYPLSHAQERFWVLSHFKDGSEAYNMASAFSIKGVLNVVAFKKAFDAMLERHEILRTVFVEVNGKAFQKILTVEAVGFKVEEIYLEGKTDGETFIRQWLQDDSRKAFDLSKGPLLRATLFHESNEQYILAFNIHHIISDGWSKEIFIKEFLDYYKSFALDRATGLQPLLIQYKDYASWHSATFSPQGEYWKELYKEKIPVLNFPTDFERPKLLTFFGAMLHTGLPVELTRQLRKMAVEQNMSLNNLLFALYGLIVAKYSRQSEIVIGSLSSGRSHIDLENLVGVFINFLPIKITVDRGRELKEFLEITNRALSMAYNNQDYPFDLVVENCIKQRDVSRNPFFDTMLNFHLENGMQGRSGFGMDQLKETGIEIKPLQSLQEDLFQSVLDFKLDIEPAGDTFELFLSYNSKLFTGETMTTFLGEFVSLLEAVVNEPGKTIEAYGEWAKEEVEINSTEQASNIPLNICASFVLEPVQEYIEYWSNEFELDIDLSFAPYNQVFQQLLDGESLLNKSRGINVLFIRIDDWLRDQKDLAPSKQIDLLNQVYSDLVTALKNSATKTFAPFLVGIVPVLGGAVLNGNVQTHIGQLNKQLAFEIKKHPSFHLLDLDKMAALYDVADVYDEKSDELGHMPFTPEYYAALGTYLARKINAFKGPNYKVIAIDCDNTLWKGIVGETGASEVIIDDNFAALQAFLIEKYNEGFLLVLCSKNNESEVWEVFDQHPGMKLKREHIAAHRINWDPKPDNMLSICKELNLGINSFIFIDDNEFEIEQMLAREPEVLSLLLPEEGNSFEDYLNHIWAFDYFRVTEEDAKRNLLYKVEKERIQEQGKFGSVNDFLQSLDVQVNILPLDETNRERAVQLTLRTNQFNVNGIRKTAAEVAASMKENAINWVIEVKDRFGDYGIVGLVLAKEKQSALVVETFLLSCRVLGRNVEDIILSRIQKYAVNNGMDRVTVLFRDTAKNKPFHEFLNRTQWVKNMDTGEYDYVVKIKDQIIA